MRGLLFLTLALLALPWAGRAEAAQDYCRWTERKLVILVDRTTAYDRVDQESLRRAFPRIVRGFRPGDRVVVQTIVDDYTRSERSFEQCVPGCPETGLLDWIYGECRPVVARADRTEFDRRLASVVLDILDNPRQFERSDILRTVAEAAREPASDDKPLAGLYVFSDLIENTAAFPWATVRAQPPARLLERVKSEGLTPHLDGAEVVVFGFGRSHDAARPALPQAERRRLEAFWKGYFEAGGAASVRIGLNYD